MTHTFAHVKWFVDKEHIQAAHPLSPNEWLAFIGLVGIGLLALLVVHRYLNKKGIEAFFDKQLRPYVKLVPLIVRYTTGLLLIINAAKELLFAPNVPTSAVDQGGLLSITLALAGVMLIVGLKTRLAATIILAVYAVSLLLVHPVIDALDHVEYLGIGLYLLLHDNTKYIRKIQSMQLMNYCSPAALLRVFVGLGLVILALSEKLIGISNSSYFLQDHHWNFLQAIGIDDRNFIVAAGIIEFLVGLTLILNIAPRLTTAIVALLMILTAILLGVEEVFGHLFALSLVAVVWLNPNNKNPLKKNR